MRTNHFSKIIIILIAFSALALAGILLRNKAIPIESRKYGQFGQELFDGRILAVVDSLCPDHTCPSVSTESFFVNCKFKNMSKKDFHADVVVVDYYSIPPRGPIFRNCFYLTKNLETPNDSILELNIKPEQLFELTSFGHFYNSTGQHLIKINLYQRDSVVGGPFIVSDVPSDASNLFNQFSTIKYSSQLPDSIESYSLKREVVANKDSNQAQIAISVHATDSLLKWYARNPQPFTEYRYGDDGHLISAKTYYPKANNQSSEVFDDQTLPDSTAQLFVNQLTILGITEWSREMGVYASNVSLLDTNAQVIRSWKCLFGPNDNSFMNELKNAILTVDSLYERWRVVLQSREYKRASWITNKYSQDKPGAPLAIGLLFDNLPNLTNKYHYNLTKEFNSNKTFGECRSSEGLIDLRYSLSMKYPFDTKLAFIYARMEPKDREETIKRFMDSSKLLAMEIWQYDAATDTTQFKQYSSEYCRLVELPSSVITYKLNSP